MRKTILLFTLLLSINLTTAQSVLLKNVNIIPMDSERVLKSQSILIKEGIISNFGDVSEFNIPENTQIIDGKNQFLLPGLTDMHVHLRNEDELINYLNYGVTTIMHMGASRSFGKRNLNFRREISEGKRLGPYIYTTGRVFDGDPPASGGAYRIATPQLAKELVLDLKRDGFDFIKVYNNITPSVFKTIIDESNRYSLPVVGHISRKMNPLDVISGGQDLIAHTEELFFTYFKGPRSTKNIDKSYRPDYSLIPSLSEALLKNKTAIIPNLSYTYADFVMWDDLSNLFSDPEIKYISPQIVRNEFHSGNINRRDNIENFIYRDQIKYTLSQELTRQFHEVGILQLLGTDATQAGIFPGKSVHRELRELVKTGLSNYDVLEIATKNAGLFAAENNFQGGNFGQIKPGYRADMILLKMNPLDDIRNAELVSGVIMQGKWLEIDYLTTLRDDIATKYQVLGDIETELKKSMDNNSTKLVVDRLVQTHNANKMLLESIESNINSMGYAALAQKDFNEAIHLFQLNTSYFPESANTWDSYAEAFLIKGDKLKAIKFYEKVLEVDQNSENAKNQLKKLRAN